jgi:hypothetical protein
MKYRLSSALGLLATGRHVSITLKVKKVVSATVRKVLGSISRELQYILCSFLKLSIAIGINIRKLKLVPHSNRASADI